MKHGCKSNPENVLLRAKYASYPLDTHQETQTHTLHRTTGKTWEA